nr:uncharacterized mitochondrial protein AtMg00810-like [Tanacetum cinerariifolium]
MRDSWGGLFIEVLRSANRLYKAQLKVGKEGTNEVGRESNDLFVTGTSLDLINEFRKIMVSQFEMSDLGELTNYLGIEVSQGKDCVEIKQERYAKKILKEAGMEDCNATSYPMKKDLKLSKAEDEPEVEATQYRKVVGYLRYLLHTLPDWTYSVGVDSRYMQSPRESHARSIKQNLRYLKGATSFGIKYKRGNDIRLVGYSSHNVDIDDGRSTIGHVFYFDASPITWCSQKQTTVALSLCEAEFMAATAAACNAIWLKELLAKVTGLERQNVIIRVDNKSAIALSKNPVFHGRSKHIHTQYHFIRECVENEQSYPLRLRNSGGDTGFEDVVGRLKAYEERVKEEDKANDPQENFLYATTEYFNGNNDSNGGRGCDLYSRGRGRGRGQGRGRGN